MTEETFLSACASHEKIGACQFTINHLEAAKKGGPLYLCKEGNHTITLACLQGEEKQKVLDIVIEERRRRREEAQREFEAI